MKQILRENVAEAGGTDARQDQKRQAWMRLKQLQQVIHTHRPRSSDSAAIHCERVSPPVPLAELQRFKGLLMAAQGNVD